MCWRFRLRCTQADERGVGHSSAGGENAKLRFLIAVGQNRSSILTSCLFSLLSGLVHSRCILGRLSEASLIRPETHTERKKARVKAQRSSRIIGGLPADSRPRVQLPGIVQRVSGELSTSH
jgi:hypothetical protein